MTEMLTTLRGLTTLFMPEIILSGVACLVILLEAFQGERWRKLSYLLGLGGLLGAAFFTHETLFSTDTVYACQGAWVCDPVSHILKLFIYALMALIFIFSRTYMEQRDIFRGETIALLLLSQVGTMILVSSASFLTLYLGLELFALPIYALIAMAKTRSIYAEAALKYFVMGAIASGLMLYGISLLYGVSLASGGSGSLNFSEILRVEILDTAKLKLPFEFGMIFVLAGLVFKLGAVPFHMWLPDVYEGSPTSVTIYIATVAKVGAFGMALRLLHGFNMMHSEWQLMLTGIAIISIVLGNLVAIVQTNFKRMLAYSTISHVGFILLGFVANPDPGFSAAMFYTIIYVFTALATFGIIMLLSSKGFEAEQIQDFAGLSQRHPGIALMLLILMLSMAGIPPTAGFYAKFMVINSLLKSDLLPLAIVALLFSVVGAFYYLRIIRVMYFDTDRQAGAKVYPDTMAISGRGLVYVNSSSILALGLYPAALWALCHLAISHIK